MAKQKIVNKKKSVWSNSEIVILVTIFYLLGFLTAILFYIMTMYPDSPLGFLEKETPHKVENKVTVERYDGSFRYDLQKIDKIEEEKSEEDYLLWESTTAVRSALYQFVKKEGDMPRDLSVLIGEYIPGLPQEPLTFSNEVVSKYTGTGGWVYRPTSVKSTEDDLITKAIEKAVIPNVTDLKRKDIPFEPVKINILQNENQLLIVSGTNIIRNYKVGLGVDKQTPTGTFYIMKKVMNPNHLLYPLDESPFGRRGLQLSNPLYAIHGTNEPESIGKNLSQGCIRMLNKDVVELYSMVPLYTTIDIISGNVQTVNEGIYVKQQGKSTFYHFPTEEKSSSSLYDLDDKPSEQDSKNFYFWAS
jgi:lipoprotein-anchoring transpeptidase ErfK/SrfK